MKKTWFVFLFFSYVCASEPPLLNFGVGVFDIKHEKYRTAEFRVEYRPNVVWYTFRPTVGVMATAKGSHYIYAGFGFEWFIKRFMFSPNFAVGYYGKGGGKDLGFPIEFRSGVEVGFKFPNHARLGLHFYHMSNARKLFHWSSRNPGEESLVLFYSFPISY
ncbi:MAG: acyloxyacyl hydrolase [Chlamydiota bacterium]